jgi:hypothetical protein
MAKRPLVRSTTKFQLQT